jgi:uncharacterized protein YrrD
MELGEPTSYLTLTEGIAVYASGGEKVGTVAEVLAAPEQDIFEGIAISPRLGVGHRRFAAADLIAEIGEKGVLLSLPKDACESLPAPP